MLKQVQHDKRLVLVSLAWRTRETLKQTGSWNSGTLKQTGSWNEFRMTHTLCASVQG